MTVVSLKPLRIFVSTVLFAALVFTGLSLAGCSPLENRARDAAAASQGFIQQAQRNHLAECQANPAKPFPCQTINQAIAAQNLLIDAIEQYCGWPSGTQPSGAASYPCAKNVSAQQRLQAAINSINQIIKDYKGAL